MNCNLNIINSFCCINKLNSFYSNLKHVSTFLKNYVCFRSHLRWISWLLFRLHRKKEKYLLRLKWDQTLKLMSSVFVLSRMYILWCNLSNVAIQVLYREIHNILIFCKYLSIMRFINCINERANNIFLMYNVYMKYFSREYSQQCTLESWLDEQPSNSVISCREMCLAAKALFWMNVNTFNLYMICTWHVFIIIAWESGNIFELYH